MKKLRVALIGYGRSGRDIHNHMFKQSTDKYEVTVGVEIDAQRRDMMRAELGIEPLDDYRKLVDVQDKFDFVVNASFSMDHAPISRYLLEHGMTVLSEKPAARDVADFEDILAAEKRGGGHYHVFQLPLLPEFMKIKEIIAEGTLGRIVQVALQYDGFSRRWDWQTISFLVRRFAAQHRPASRGHGARPDGLPQGRARVLRDGSRAYAGRR